MTAPAIQVRNLGKLFRIGARQDSYKRLTETVTDLALAPLRRLQRLGKPVPPDEEIWALRDVSFDVMPGEVVGVIGRNGAGKSTLLKILSRITEPTTGEAIIRGRVGSLLEVGTGFHPELTGRENIFLNGAILGMKRAEIKNKFDEIVAFAEIDRFLDTPVKRYSSGMYVRLAFAVAAHLEPEILLVDEVLAVGDAQFQKKCLGKMGDVARGGRTVLFVSHNMAAIQAMCSLVCVLDSGTIALTGKAQAGISAYFKMLFGSSDRRDLAEWRNRVGGDKLRILKYDIVGRDGQSLKTVGCGDSFRFEVFFRVFSESIGNLRIGVTLRDQRTGRVVTDFNSYYCSNESLSCTMGIYRCVFTIKKLPLSSEQYSLSLLSTSGLEVLDWIKDIGTLIVTDGLFYSSGHMPRAETDQAFFSEFDFELLKETA